jgi:ubiquinone/menaquinone biosynthesis C-methylase UbiE
MTRDRTLVDVFKTFFGRGVCPYEASLALLNPLRRLILSPEQLVSRLNLAPDARVLELGTGPGYFSPMVARQVPDGQWVGFDLQHGMLRLTRDRLSRRLPERAPAALDFAQGDARALPFAAGVFDVIFLVAVLGEVSDPAQCLRACRRVLASSGLLSITEQPGDPDAMNQGAIRHMAERSGFVFREGFGRGESFTLNFSAVTL